jgi:hypothetical protein
MLVAYVAVGVEPTLTIGHGSLARASSAAHFTTARRSRSDIA